MKVDAQGMPIRKLLTDGVYTIPDYQREYDWETEQINELLEDINEIDNNESYFIGHMVFEGKRDGDSFTVIDGQQRITTITIMLCCLRDIFYAKGEIGLGDGINDNYIFCKDVDNTTSARLINKMPYPVLQARVQNVPKNKDENVLPNKNGEKKIITAYDHIYNLFNEYSTDKLKQLRDKILNLETVSVVTEGISDACTIFMTLNSTGKDLTPFDLVKSLIFSKYKRTPLINEPDDTWKKINDNIKQNSKFLNNFFASRYKKVSDRRIFKEVEKTIKSINPDDNGAGAKEFLRQMLNDSEIYKLINEPSQDQWGKKDYDIYESIFAIIKQFKIQVSNSFLIALIRDYQDNKIKKNMCLKVLLVMERFHFVNNAVCSNRSSGIDLLYAKFAHELYNAGTKQDKHKIINKVCEDLTERIADISDFTANVDSKLYYTKSDEKQKELVKYVLIKMERKKNNHSIPIATSIEHVYPETSQNMTLENPDLIKNIGNLVLLEDNINSKIGNRNYLGKKNYVLEKSKMITAKQLFNTYNKWEDSEISQRRKELINEMYQTMWE
ncbi:MAG: DUF262 domain-containing protein [Paludibacteraceae bacterium]|nr:DUF262 domain-containing protein [Paludibacteraceae bacterium]